MKKKRGQARLTAAMPNSALERDAAKNAVPHSLVRGATRTSYNGQVGNFECYNLELEKRVAMLHAPTSEAKTETTQSKSQLVPQPERELHPRLLSAAGPHSASGMNGVASGASPKAQRRQTFTGMQSTHGNQAVLRMLQSPQQVTRMSTLRPSQGVMLQRKCACGGSEEKEGECAECKAKHEGTLQRQAANPAVSPAIGVIQTKLAINKPGDQYEQEADRVADQVTTTSAHHAVSGAHQVSSASQDNRTGRGMRRPPA